MLSLFRRCRCHWHGQIGAWWCCRCDRVSDDTTKPSHRTTECTVEYSFLDGPLALPPERNIVRRSRRAARRAAA